MGIGLTMITLLHFVWLAKYDFKLQFSIVKYKDVKDIHFCVILLTKKFVLSMIIRIFAASVPTKPLNDAQMRGAFLYIYVLLSKCANGKITALHETLHDRGRFGGSVEKSWAYHFR